MTTELKRGKMPHRETLSHAILEMPLTLASVLTSFDCLSRSIDVCVGTYLESVSFFLFKKHGPSLAFCLFILSKWGNLSLFLFMFGRSKHLQNFAIQQCYTYLVLPLGFELTTSCTLISSHNHQTMAVFSLKLFVFRFCNNIKTIFYRCIVKVMTQLSNCNALSSLFCI